MARISRYLLAVAAVLVLGGAALAFYANYLERLAEILVRKNILSRDELRALREAARSEPGVTRHEIWRVADVDQV